MSLIRIHDEDGFQLIEVLIAMTILAIGISAIVAGFSSGMLAVVYAGRASTAATLADTQMETYRADTYDTLKTLLTCGSGAQASAVCNDTTAATGADGRSYPVVQSISWSCATSLNGNAGGTVAAPTCAGARPTLRVSIAVRDPDTSRVLVRETSTFDQA